MGEPMEFDDIVKAGTYNDSFDGLMSEYIYEDNETKENWIVYFKGKTKGDFEEWLENHKPSQISKKRYNVDWICVSREREVREDLDIRVAEMVDAWEKLDTSSGRPRNEVVKELAKNFRITSGKWLFFVDSGGKADYLWSVVAHGIINGKLTCDSAKINAAEEDDETHVICMYNPDFTNMDQVMEAEASIRNLGIKCRMQYKPDAYTYLGIYGGNQWGMRPYIMKSDFDITKGASVIREGFY